MNFDRFALALAGVIYLQANKAHTSRVKEYACDVYDEDRYDAMVAAGRLADQAEDAEMDVADALFDKGVWIDFPKAELVA